MRGAASGISGRPCGPGHGRSDVDGARRHSGQRAPSSEFPGGSAWRFNRYAKRRRRQSDARRHQRHAGDGHSSSLRNHLRGSGTWRREREYATRICGSSRLLDGQAAAMGCLDRLRGKLRGGGTSIDSSARSRCPRLRTRAAPPRQRQKISRC